MPAQYYIGDVYGTNLSGQSLQIAKAISEEMEGEVITRRGVQGLIRLAADATGVGKYVDLDKVLKDFLESRYLVPEK